MNPEDNPYTPGAGVPPPELAGREEILTQAENVIKPRKTKKNVVCPLFCPLFSRISCFFLINCLLVYSRFKYCQPMLQEREIHAALYKIKCP